MLAEHMTMNARTPLKPQGAPLSSSGSRPHARVVQAIPTVEEAKRRLAEAAGRPEPWLTPEGMAMLEQAEEASGGVFGPKT